MQMTLTYLTYWPPVVPGDLKAVHVATQIGKDPTKTQQAAAEYDVPQS